MTTDTLAAILKFATNSITNIFSPHLRYRFAAKGCSLHHPDKFDGGKWPNPSGSRRNLDGVPVTASLQPLQKVSSLLFSAGGQVLRSLAVSTHSTLDSARFGFDIVEGTAIVHKRLAGAAKVHVRRVARQVRDTARVYVRVFFNLRGKTCS